MMKPCSNCSKLTIAEDLCVRCTKIMNVLTKSKQSNEIDLHDPEKENKVNTNLKDKILELEKIVYILQTDIKHLTKLLKETVN